jgi:hypothetical protein
MLESLPNELLLFIFDYLRAFEIIDAFGNLNARFERIIQPYLLSVDFTVRQLYFLSFVLSLVYYHIIVNQLLLQHTISKIHWRSMLNV